MTCCFSIASADEAIKHELRVSLHSTYNYDTRTYIQSNFVLCSFVFSLETRRSNRRYIYIYIPRGQRHIVYKSLSKDLTTPTSLCLLQRHQTRLCGSILISIETSLMLVLKRNFNGTVRASIQSVPNEA